MRPNVLLVDDEVLLIATLGRVLTAAGMEVHTARSGLEAMEHLRKIRYDAIVTDLTMEGIDGFDLLRRVREIDPDVCVTVITGYADEKSGIQALREGAEDYLLKPFQPEELVLRVRLHIEKTELRRKIRLYEQALGVCTGCHRIPIRTNTGEKRWVLLEERVVGGTNLPRTCPDCEPLCPPR